jgi:hypothetical protein
MNRSRYKITAFEELSPLLDHDDFEVIDLADVPTKEKVISTKWKLHIKLNIVFKTRLTARGYQQTLEWIIKKLSPALSKSSFLLLLAISNIS